MGWKEGNGEIKNWGERVRERLGDEEGERPSEKGKRNGVRRNEKEQKIVPSFCSLLALPLLPSLSLSVFLPSLYSLSPSRSCLVSLSLIIIYSFLICYKTGTGVGGRKGLDESEG